MLLFLKGLLIGFCIAAPVGPIGILCIKRTLKAGRWAGFFSGLGAAAADAIYGLIAALSLTAISSFLIKAQSYFRLIGGLFLIYLGVKIFLEKPAKEAGQASENRSLYDFSSTFLLTLTNPMTIFSFMAIFAGLGLVMQTSDYKLAVLFVLGVFLGSLVWWLILAELVTLFRKRVNTSLMKGINRVAGSLIILFGLGALYSLLHS